MDASLRRRAEELFQAALDLDSSERTGYLDQQCGSNADLRAEVEQLFKPSEEALDQFLKTAAFGLARQAAEEAAKLPASLGAYTIVRKIGEGGMGIVYEAKQQSPRRSVALKVIRSAFVTRSMLTRFEREVEILGRLQHPGIAQVYEAGMASLNDNLPDSTKHPFFAMELVRGGKPLTQYAAEKNFGSREKMELIALVCDAVHHAHQQGVIHRDLKPANILVTESGQPKILDFGVARVTDDEMQRTTLQTGVGQLVGTLPYMSPEQVTGQSAELDARGDVYALGVILFELLTGRLPHDLHDRTIPDAARVIQDEEPIRLSSIDPIFRGDVETIVAKALEKDPARRYATATELAQDIRRYLRDEPIVARPAGTFYNFRKFARRNKALVGGVTATMLVLIIGIVVATLLAIREVRVRREAQWLAYRASVAAAASALRGFDCESARQQLERAPESLRGWEWHYLNSRLDDSAVTIRTDRPWSGPVAFLENDSVLRVFVHQGMADVQPPERPALQDFELLSVNSSTGHVSGRRMLRTCALITFNPRADQIAWIEPDMRCYSGRSMDGADVVALGTAAYDARKERFSRAPVTQSADGRHFLWLEDGQLYRVKTATGQKQALPEAPLLDSTSLVIFSPDGSLIAFSAFAGGHAEILVWETDTLRLRYRTSELKEQISAIAFSPDGTRLAAVSENRAIRQWFMEGSSATSWDLMTGHTDRILALVHDPRGTASPRPARIGRSGFGTPAPESRWPFESATKRKCTVLFSVPTEPAWLPDRQTGRFGFGTYFRKAIPMCSVATRRMSTPSPSLRVVSALPPAVGTEPCGSGTPNPVSKSFA
jgi:serine/threonine protein kinase